MFTYANSLYKELQVWTTINNIAYIISYSALAKDGYENNLALAQVMIQSVEITATNMKYGQQESSKGLYSYADSYHDISVQYPTEWIVDERAHSKRLRTINMFCDHISVLIQYCFIFSNPTIIQLCNS